MKSNITKMHGQRHIKICFPEFSFFTNLPGNQIKSYCLSNIISLFQSICQYSCTLYSGPNIRMLFFLRFSSNQFISSQVAICRSPHFVIVCSICFYFIIIPPPYSFVCLVKIPSKMFSFLLHVTTLLIVVLQKLLYNFTCLPLVSHVCLFYVSCLISLEGQD